MIIQPANRLNIVKEYYFSRKLREIREMREAGKDVLNLGIGSPDLAPSQGAITALTETALNDNNHGYQSYTGIPELRTAISNWYERVYGVAIDFKNEALPLMGSKEGIMHISMAFLNEGDGVLVPNPGYLTYSSVANLLGAKIHPYTLKEANNWEPNWAALEELDLTSVKLMWVNYPNMPTGADATDALFAKLIAFAKKHELLIVNDNPYSLILNPQPRSIMQQEGAKEVALELNSLSKSHNMAGWRVGMVVGDYAYLSNILKVKSNMDSGMFLGIQKAAIAALNNTTQWHQSQSFIYQQRRQVARQIMDELGCKYNENQVGMFIWAKVPDAIEDVAVWMDELLHQANVFITPGFIFGSSGERYIRLSLCSKRAVLQQALDRVRSFES